VPSAEGACIPLQWMECCNLFHAACEMYHTLDMIWTVATAGHEKKERMEVKGSVFSGVALLTLSSRSWLA